MPPLAPLRIYEPDSKSTIFNVKRLYHKNKNYVTYREKM